MLLQTFGFKAWESPLILIGGTDFHITAASGAVIDGNGAAWWDGQGDNGVEKYEICILTLSFVHN